MPASGAVTDRPWGITLAGFGLQGFTGLLKVTADGKQYSISFDLGRIVGATSPLASDAAVRIALTNHLVSSSQAAELNRQILAAKDRDELEVLAGLAGLSPRHVETLRHRMVAQRAARTFSIDSGTYVADERIAMPPGADLDVREVIYLGARMNLSEQRLTAALRTFGTVFTITPDALPILEQFGFSDDVRPVIDGLIEGASLPQLEAGHREIDPRMVQAIVYALVTCQACDASTAAGSVVAYSDGPEVAPRTSAQNEGATYFVSRTATPVPAQPGTDEIELPSLTEVSGTTRGPRTTTSLPAPTNRSRPRPPVDEGVARNPPPASRTLPGGPLTGDRPPFRANTSDPTSTRVESVEGVPSHTGERAPSRGHAFDPGNSRTQAGERAPSRGHTSDATSPRTPADQRAPARGQTSGPPTSRTPTGEPITSRAPSSDMTGFRSEPVAPRTPTTRANPGTSTVRAPGQPTIPKGGRASTEVPGSAAPSVARTPTGRTQGPAVSRTSTARRTQALIAARLILVDQAADHFTLLGVPFDASTDVIQTAYLNLVRQLHPDRLDQLGVPDLSGNAQRLFHQIGVAFTVLTDPGRRAGYMEKLVTPAPPVELTSRTRTSEDVGATPAGDAFRRGEAALRRDQPGEAVIELGRACALEPNNVDFHAMLGWAQFCASRDKVTIAPETRKALAIAIQKSPKPIQAKFLLGRVERILGRDREALRHFREVVEDQPQHSEANAEIRAIEARIAMASKR